MSNLNAPYVRSIPEWSTPNELILRNDEIHVWRASLGAEGKRLPKFLGLLSADEKRRATRFHFEKDRTRFIAARAFLRMVLGRYVETAPSRLRFRYNSYGKPSIAAADDGRELSFNLAHSEDLALLGITRGREIGVDVERIRLESAGEEIARQFFSRREVVALDSLPAEQRTEAFFRCWVRKEAYIKAKGEGLSIPLDQFDVSLRPDEPPALLSATTDEETSDWYMKDLSPGPGYMAALAVKGQNLRLKCWLWA